MGRRTGKRRVSGKRTPSGKKGAPARPRLGERPKPEGGGRLLRVTPHTKDFKRYGKRVEFHTKGTLFRTRADAQMYADMMYKGRDLYGATIARPRIVEKPRTYKNNRSGWLVYERYAPWPRRSEVKTPPPSPKKVSRQPSSSPKTVMPKRPVPTQVKSLSKVPARPRVTPSIDSIIGSTPPIQPRRRTTPRSMKRSHISSSFPRKMNLFPFQDLLTPRRRNRGFGETSRARKSVKPKKQRKTKKKRTRIGAVFELPF